MKNDLTLKELDSSVNKKYKKEILAKAIKAIKDYSLISEGDVIGVCISGGKDSFLLALVLKNILKHKKINFSLKYITLDPGYLKGELKMIKEIAKKLDIDLNIYKKDIFGTILNSKLKNPCVACSKIRRGSLYSYAKSLGCNKIALGHHLDDVVETLFLSMFYNGLFETMTPILKSDNFSNMALIRPLYLVKESDIQAWRNYTNLEFLSHSCKIKNSSKKRDELKEVINALRKNNKYFDANFISSITNINLGKTLNIYKQK